MRQGYRGTTLARIQKEAGVHAGSFYWHFPDKDAVFAAMVREGRENQALVVASLGQEADNPVQAVLDSIVERPERYGLWRFNLEYMLDQANRQTSTADEIRALRAEMQRVLTAAWLEQLPAAVLEKVPALPQRMADYSLAVVEGCVLSRVAGTARDEDFVTRTATVVMDQMVTEACRAVGEPVPPFFRHGRGGLADLVARPTARGVDDPPECS